MHRLCHILLFLLPMISVGQNLVPNGTFNFPDTCTAGAYFGPFELPPWFVLYSSPDCYHPCFNQGLTVPLSSGGFEDPHSGEGYIGLYTYTSNQLTREFMSVELSSELEQDVSYHASLYVSLADSIWYASKNIGMWFSESVPQVNPSNPNPTLQYLLSVEPQVKYEGTDFLTNKNGWTKIEGSFIANGGERYLTIANFDNDAETDTLFIPGGGIPPSHSEVYWSGSYYFIDDVSVIPDSIFQSVNVNDFTFSIYPNPATTNLTIESRTPLAQVCVRDVAGRAIMNETLRSAQSDNHTIDVSGLPSGIYLVEVLKQNGQRSVQKVVVE